MNTEKLREAFEAWSKSEYLNLQPGHYEEYLYPTVQTSWQAYQHAHKLAWDAQQAVIDRLMLEFCPDEITPEQLKNLEDCMSHILEKHFWPQST